MLKNNVNRKSLGQGFKWAVFILVLLGALYFLSVFLSPAAVVYPTDYIRVSYEPPTFSKTEVLGDEIFYGAASGSITWTKRFSFFRLLFLLIREVKVVAAVQAQNQDIRDWVTLNAGHTINIKPFPRRKGEVYPIEEKVALQFPKAAKSGDYNLVVKLVRADAKLFLWGWVDVRSYLPQWLEVGAIKYIAQ